MPGEAIVGHLENVLAQEQMPYEVPALRLLGQAAGGSMRDALSLTDQAIAYSAGNLKDHSLPRDVGNLPSGLRAWKCCNLHEMLGH